MKQGTSIIFINDKFQILLVKRDDKKDIPFPGYWDVPGGHVEDNETPKACIIREMKEEIETEIKDPLLFNTYDMPDRIEHTYWLNADLDISRINLHEGQYLRWFSEDEINRLSDRELAFGFKSILEDFFKHKPFMGKR
jgi:8-oxo-dGTP diphosphatase